MRALLAAVAFGVALGALSMSPEAAHRDGRQGRAPADAARDILKTLAAYETDDAAVERWLRTPDGLRAVPHVPATLSSHEWSRTTAAFFLEVAIEGRDLFALRLGIARGGPTSLNAGRVFVTRRPGQLGDNAIDDRFEILWHQIALALLQGTMQYTAQQDYLDAIGPRLDEARQRGVAVDGRLPLARAIAAGGQCCPRRFPEFVIYKSFPSRTTSFGAPDRTSAPAFDDTPSPLPTSTDALALYDRAAQAPALHAEALIRAGAILHMIGQEADAVASFDRATLSPSDRLLGYVQQLLRGRALDALDRPADAAEAYRAATEYAPQSQLASLGLAAALLRSGHADDAVLVADHLRRMPDDGIDYLREFERADARFVQEWLTELRRMRR